MKRDPRLRGLSSDHHAALVLARTLRRSQSWGDAQAKEVEARFRDELEPHFLVEEDVLLPALEHAGEDDLVNRTRHDHAEIRKLLRSAISGQHAAAQELGRVLEEHVRFEERQLFPVCEARLASEVLDEVGRRAPKN